MTMRAAVSLVHARFFFHGDEYLLLTRLLPLQFTALDATRGLSAAVLPTDTLNIGFGYFLLAKYRVWFEATSRATM